MIDHVVVDVSDVDKAKRFYSAALKPLGYELLADHAEMKGFKSGEGIPDFWIRPGEKPVTSVHIAFNAKTRAAVDAFYEAAMAASGTDNGGPGLRKHYHPYYYGAFVLDADGHNIEAVCHIDEG